ncbi:MAG: acyl-[acyl-carrier-protein] thioesterase [Butyricicoccus sp.]
MVDLLTREYEVNYSHIDNRGIAKPSFLWNIMQDAATVHAEALHIGPLDLRIVWVLSRMKARLTRPLLPYERLRCETWCPGIKGASWYRSFSFFVDNKPVGDAQSMWVTLDPETHRIVRPSAFPEAEQYLHTSRGELFAPLPKLSCDNVRLHHVHEVRYSDLDVNNHVNNVRAVELISDALDLYRQPGFVSELQVNYTAETACGESLSLLTGTADSARYIRGEADGRTRFEALCHFRRCPTRRSWYDASDRAGCMRHFGRVPAGQNHPVCGKSVRWHRQAQGVQPLRYRAGERQLPHCAHTCTWRLRFPYPSV